MRSDLEFEGKNIDVAVQKAAKKLDISTDKLKYETLSTGSSGIFGLVGAKNARIRVLNQQTEKKSKNGQTDTTQSDRDMVQSLVDETFAGTAPKPVAETPPPKRAAGPKAPKPKTEKPSEEKMPVDENGFHKGSDVLQKILDQITTDAKASFEYKNNRVVFNVEGGNAAVLIGKRGQTLKAIQHLVEKVVWKSSGARLGVQVDVEQYMEKRASSLKDLAVRLAAKTRQTGKPSTINRIDAFERKIIHDALRKDKRVKTKSVGSGDLRNVVIHSTQRSNNNKPAAAEK